MDLLLIWLIALILAALAMKIDARRNDVLYGGFIDGPQTTTMVSRT
jgi:hypothetical protein